VYGDGWERMVLKGLNAGRNEGRKRGGEEGERERERGRERGRVRAGGTRQAYSLGAPIQKLFPGVMGGANWVRAVSAALPVSAWKCQKRARRREITALQTESISVHRVIGGRCGLSRLVVSRPVTPRHLPSVLLSFSSPDRERRGEGGRGRERGEREYERGREREGGRER
jgi:hypothetical protein